MTFVILIGLLLLADFLSPLLTIQLILADFYRGGSVPSDNELLNNIAIEYARGSAGPI